MFQKSRFREFGDMESWEKGGVHHNDHYFRWVKTIGVHDRFQNKRKTTWWNFNKSSKSLNLFGNLENK